MLILIESHSDLQLSVQGWFLNSNHEIRFKFTQAEVKTTEQVETVKQEEIDINLDDPEVEQAAVKIQAGFKGMKARREVQAKREVIFDVVPMIIPLSRHLCITG